VKLREAIPYLFQENVQIFFAMEILSISVHQEQYSQIMPPSVHPRKIANSLFFEMYFPAEIIPDGLVEFLKMQQKLMR